MNTSELDLRELLSFKPRGGAISFLGQRMYLKDLFSHGLQQMELCRTLGPEITQSIIVRAGFSKGWLVAERIKRQMPDAWAEARKGKLGPLLCSMYGFGEVLSSQRRDGIQATPLVETYFISLYEAEQHLRMHGLSNVPVCWEQIGFASGYVSNLEGRTVYFIEDECQAKGDSYCHLRGNYLEQWGEEITPYLPVYSGICNETVATQLADVLRSDEALPRNMQDKINLSLKLTSIEDGYPVSNSYAMRSLLEMAINVAKVPTSVLITGESGVGKEKLVQYIHKNSPRSDKPLVAINCGALNETLLENELFGHVRGAFTGADCSKSGLIEAADGGTLFLDEVAELSPATQVKLLRVLQEKEVRRLGDTETNHVDVRIISATNKSLEAAVEAGEFRQDLYYRLKVIELNIPPLRERTEDILPLSRYFLMKFNQELGKSHTGFHYKTADLLLSHNWPGNVRELVNAIERAVVLSAGPQIMPEDLPHEIRDTLCLPSVAGDIRALHEVEKDYILAVLEKLDNNKTQAAEKLGMSLATLYRKLKEYGALQIAICSWLYSIAAILPGV